MSCYFHISLLSACVQMRTVSRIITLQYPKASVPHIRLWHYRSAYVVFFLSLPIDNPLSVLSLLQAIASSMASLTMVWNIGWSVLYLHEPLLVIDLICTATLIVGAVIAVVFGRKGNMTSSFLSPGRIRRIFRRPIAIVSGIVVAGLMAALLSFIWYLDWAKTKHERQALAPRKGNATTSSVVSSQVGAVPVNRWMLKAGLLSRIALAGLFSAWTGTTSKGMTTMVSHLEMDG